MSSSELYDSKEGMSSEVLPGDANGSMACGHASELRYSERTRTVALLYGVLNAGMSSALGQDSKAGMSSEPSSALGHDSKAGMSGSLTSNSLIFKEGGGGVRWMNKDVCF